MDKIDKEKEKIGDKKMILKLKSVDQLKSLGVNKFQEINLEKYKEVIVSQAVALSEQLFENIFCLNIVTDLFRIEKFISIDKQNRVLKLYYSSYTMKYFYSKLINPDWVEKLYIRFQTDPYCNSQNIEQYVKKLPNLTFISLNMNFKHKSANQDLKNRLDLIEKYKHIENVELIINDVKLIKKKNNIQVEQLVSTQKQLIKNEQMNNIQIQKTIDKLIDLTIERSTTIIKELFKEKTIQNELIQVPQAIKCNPSCMKKAKQCVEKFPNINQIILVSNKSDENSQDFYENFKNIIQSLQKLKKITFIDENGNDFITKHYKIITICKQKFTDFKISYLYKQQKMIMYYPHDRFLKIVDTLITEEEFISIFSLYSDIRKIYISSSQETVQNAIKVLHMLKNLKILTIHSIFLYDSFDFIPLYGMDLEKIKFSSVDQYGNYQTKLFYKFIESLLNHPTCPKICSNGFSFNSQSNQVVLELHQFKQCDLFSHFILNKYKNTEKIIIKKSNELTWSYFFANVLTSPSLLSIKNEQAQNYYKDQWLNKIFKMIQVQKIQIIAIQKHQQEFIPVFLPSLIYDLFV